MSRPRASFIEVHPTETRFRLMLEDADARSRVEFTYIEGGDDDFFQEIIEGQFARTQVLGRTADFLTYSGAGSREVNMVLRFFAETANDLVDEVESKVGFLQASQLAWQDPDDPSGIRLPPPKYLLQLGGFRRITGRLTSVQVRWQRPVSIGSTFQDNNGQIQQIFNLRLVPGAAPQGPELRGLMSPYGAEVSFTFTDLTPLLASDVMIGNF
jgi:hypothetical protein